MTIEEIQFAARVVCGLSLVAVIISAGYGLYQCYQMEKIIEKIK
jgi:hypothetical protein